MALKALEAGHMATGKIHGPPDILAYNNNQNQNRLKDIETTKEIGGS